MMTTGKEVSEFVLGGEPLRFDVMEAIARAGVRVDIAPDALAKIDDMRARVERRAYGHDAIYGVNTGFGSLSRVRIKPTEVAEVQRNLIRSHATGVGDSLPIPTVRGMMTLLVASLLRSRSGVRSDLIGRLVELLNANVTPVVPSRGSVGASGDLAPLAHIALVLMGEGEAWVNARRTPAPVALRQAGIEPIALQAKEGLALINGTHLMASAGSLALVDLDRLVRAALCASSMAIDACRASDTPFDARIHQVREHDGQREVAAAICNLIEGSSILQDHKVDDPRVQDPYCLRTIPQVLGAVVDTLRHAAGVFAGELASVTDNPLIFPSTHDPDALDILSGGNFHGMPLAIAMDSMKIAITHLAGISERRTNWLLTASDQENPVNPYLSPQPGLHSGMMIAQYTAAACCNEIATLANPASVHNVTTSAGIEDYNSMGATAAHHLQQSVDLATNVVAIELLVMAEALEYQRPLRSGHGVEKTHDRVREVVPRLTEDRSLTTDIASIVGLITRGAFDTMTPLTILTSTDGASRIPGSGDQQPTQ